MFRKKKKKELEELGLNEDEIISFDDFKDLNEKDIDEEEQGPTDFEKHFIFHISGGCPICGGDVKGNDHFRYLCDECNVLFDRKDLIESEFGRSTGGVRKTRLTEDERTELDRKRGELKDRVFREFSEKEKQELKEEAEEREEQGTEEAEEKPEEVEAEVIPPYEDTDEEEPAEDREPKGIDEVIDEVPEEPEAEEGYEDEGVEADEEEPAEDYEEDDRQRREEYGLESPDKIIASNESTKMHKGDCHFVKRIHPKNRIYLESVEQGQDQGFEMCVCLRRLKAKQR